MITLDLKIIVVWVFSLRSPIRLSRFQYKNYKYVVALVFAIEEINRNHHFLPNISLGVDLYNVLHYEQRTLESSLTWLSGLGNDIPNYTCRRESKSLAALTGTTCAISSQIGTLQELYKFPQVRLCGMGRHETMSTLMPFSGAWKGRKEETVFMHLSQDVISKDECIES